MDIRPFRAVRPAPEHAARVASVPYDVVDREEARALAQGNAESFLHVVRPDIDLPDGASESECHGAAARALADLQRRGVLLRDDASCLYVYRQRMGTHVQRGVVACCSVRDYQQGAIKRHEFTRPDKENERAAHIRAVRAHTGPVFLTYRDEAVVDRLVAAAEAGPPLYDFTAPDGIEHAAWRVPGTAAWLEAFQSVPAFYIADGHHRAASASRVALALGGADGVAAAAADHAWFLTVLFPASQLRILPYNRCVADLGGRSAGAFVAAVGGVFDVTPDAEPEPAAAGDVRMYVAGRWYACRVRPPVPRDPVAALDVSVLQDRLLAPILGIDDPRTSPRIEFVGGIRGTRELVKRVDAGRAAVAFSMYPTSIEQLLAVADAGQVMPPKSTWFEPKLRSGLFVHTFG
jgi:uncharacterized protein (DUF1015 family)